MIKQFYLIFNLFHALSFSETHYSNKTLRQLIYRWPLKCFPLTNKCSFAHTKIPRQKQFRGVVASTPKCGRKKHVKMNNNLGTHESFLSLKSSSVLPLPLQQPVVLPRINQAQKQFLTHFCVRAWAFLRTQFSKATTTITLKMGAGKEEYIMIIIP